MLNERITDMRADSYSGNSNIIFPGPVLESTHPLPLSHSPSNQHKPCKLEETEKWEILTSWKQLLNMMSDGNWQRCLYPCIHSCGWSECELMWKVLVSHLITIMQPQRAITITYYNLIMTNTSRKVAITGGSIGR